MPVFDVAASQGASAPYWFVELFKTIGFALHLIPMGIWLVGIPCSLLLWLFGGVTSKRLAQRFFRQLPLIVTLGVSFGVLPLLFTQLAYPKAFYTTTIVLGAHWFFTTFLAALAYYVSYLAACAARAEKFWRTALYAFLASCCYSLLGLIFSSVWTLFERPWLWESVWADSAYSIGKFVLGPAATASGLGYYWTEVSVFLRFAGIVGIGFFALSTWFIVDAYYLYRGPRKLTSEEQARLRAAEAAEEEAEEEGKKSRPPRKPIQENAEAYVSWTTSVAFILLLPGLLISAPAVGKYALDSAGAFVDDENWNPILWNVLLCCAGASMFFPFVFILLNKLKKLSGRALAVMSIVCEVALVGVYASMRQILQNARLGFYYDIKGSCEAGDVDWIALIVFFVTFVLSFSLVFFIVGRLSSGDKKRPAKKPRKAPKEEKNADSGKEKGSESSLGASGQARGNVIRSSSGSNPGQIRSLNNPNRPGNRR